MFLHRSTRLLACWLTLCLSVVSCDKPVRLEFGIPDTSTYVGKLLHYPIPRDAFSGTNIRYKINGRMGKPLPSWLVFDSQSNVLEGVPTAPDVGELYIEVKARDGVGGSVRDVFAVQVLAGSLLDPNSNDKRKCKVGENIAMLSLVVDKALADIPPKQRVQSLKNLAGFLGFETNQLTMLPQKYQDSNTDSILASGQGDVKRKLSHTSTVIMWQVGCEGEIWAEKIPEVEQMKQIARDGTLSEVLQLPVIGWHIINNINPFRERRDIMSDGPKTSQEGGEEEEEEDDEDNEAIPVTLRSLIGPRHRHNHGSKDAGDNSSLIYGGDAMVDTPLSSISVYENEATSPAVPEQILPKQRNLPDVLAHTQPSLLSTSSVENELTSMQSSPTAVPDMLSTIGVDTFTVTSNSSSLDDLLPSLSSNSLPAGGSKTTAASPVTTGRVSSPATSALASTVGASPETNKYPVIRNRLRKLPFTAGKPISFEIPANTFYDEEEGDTRHLKLSFKPTSPTSWIQFNKTTQEVYALPLEEHVSRWMYDVIATDKHGASVSDTLEIHVQHHRGYRSVTHEISMHLQMESLGTLKFGSMVDWQIYIYNLLLDIYGNNGNSSYITVRSIVTNKEPYVFTWTNESLPRNECPTAQINSLLEVISNTTTGQPKPILSSALGRLMTVKNITWKGVGHCDDSPPGVAKPPRVNMANLAPIIRNPIDHLEAISGQLLVYHVPEDTFFDREDGGTRKLKLRLMSMDRTTIAPTHWLQFDAKNQEFYGIPQSADEGRKEYQLVCEDSAGSTANDGLEVIVTSPPLAYYSAAFTLTLDRPLDSFSRPSAQRAFVEHLAKLFGDRDASHIVGIGFEEAPAQGTRVRWANATLANNVECPESTIGQLREILLNEDDAVQESLITGLGNDYEVLTASVTPTGICEGLKTPLHTPGVERKPAYGGKVLRGDNNSVEYLITFVTPLVVIVIMLLCAALIACLLYRRRHTGKMSIGNGVDGSVLIRSKGIPVIFQDELEERLEVSSGTKSPIIMKEEKPPLPPPDYNRDKPETYRPIRSESFKSDTYRSQPNATTALLSDIDDTSPYHPPPPIRPTPTYRQPPPYLPP